MSFSSFLEKSNNLIHKDTVFKSYISTDTKEITFMDRLTLVIKGEVFIDTIRYKEIKFEGDDQSQQYEKILTALKFVTETQDIQKDIVRMILNFPTISEASILDKVTSKK